MPVAAEPVALTILGYHIELLLALQVVSAITVIGAFSAFSALQEDELAHLSRLQTATMFRLTLAHHPTMKTVEAVLSHSVSTGTSESGVRKTQRLLDESTRRLINGATYQDDEEPSPRWLMLTILLAAGLMAPIVLAWQLYDHWRDSRLGRQELARATPLRRPIAATLTVCAVFSAGYIVAALYVEEKSAILAVGLATLGAVGIICAAAGLALLIQEQSRWKYYWRKYLGEAALSALIRNDGDAFICIMSAKVEVDTAPTVPLPAAIGFYAAVFTATQYGLTLLAQNVPWL